MKIIKAIIRKVRTATETGFTYPDKWDSTKINILAYEDTESLGEVQEYCIGIVHDDKYAEEFLKDPLVEEIDEITANTLGDQCKPQRLMVDEDVLPEMLIALSKTPDGRSKLERDMLDPDHEDKGIKKTSKFNVHDWFPE